jgi:hypothetical protein
MFQTGSGGRQRCGVSSQDLGPAFARLLPSPPACVPFREFHDEGPNEVLFEVDKIGNQIADNTLRGGLVLTNRERQVLDNVVDQLRHVGDVSPAAAVLREWLEVHAVKPLEAVADVTFAYDRHQRMMQLETARSLSRRLI